MIFGMARRKSEATLALFTAESDALKPLAERMRPRTLDEIVGQQRLLAANTPLRRATRWTAAARTRRGPMKSVA